jgi:hypothetical protein
VTLDDLHAVQRSWAQLRRQRSALRTALTGRFEANGAAPAEAEFRARWLLSAVQELVGLLSAPSCLAVRARDLGETWPDPLNAPSFAIDGRAWLAAADECLPTWSEATADAWRQAWLLLSDVLAAEALSPFADGPPPPAPEPTR